jgi:uncharacterized protein YkwD
MKPGKAGGCLAVHDPGGTEMRRGMIRLVTATALVTAVLTTAAGLAPSASATLRRERMLGWINHARVEHGAKKLQMSAYVVQVAHDHCDAMATKDKLYHSTNLSYELRTVDWSMWGENVGAGGDPYGLFKAYMASPDHRANILNKKFDHVGIAFIDRDGILWSTMIFYG